MIYSEKIDAFIQYSIDHLSTILSKNLVGIYLFGSLTYGDFIEGRSDIDLICVLKKPLSSTEMNEVRSFHKKTLLKHPIWGKRFECSYTPHVMFKSIAPPKFPRPYYGDGIFYEEAQYGNEWIINNYLLQKYGVCLMGLPISQLMDSINIEIEEIQKAAIRDLFQEWEPKLQDREWLKNDHYQSYLVLNLCRIMYSVFMNDANSKKVAANWMAQEYPEWKTLIQKAQSWKYGDTMQSTDLVIKFLQFCIRKVKETLLYKKMEM